MGIPSLQSTTSTSKVIPIGRVTFHLNSSLYEYVNGEYVKLANERISKDSSHSLIQLHEELDMLELPNNRYVKQVSHQKPTITHGFLQVRGKTSVCSRNGSILRYVEDGQTLRVLEINDYLEEKGYQHYRINKKEYICSLEPVQYTLGYIQPKCDLQVVVKGKAVTLKANELYSFSHTYDDQLFLTDIQSWHTFKIDSINFSM